MRTTRGLPIQDRGERQEFRAKTLLQLANMERIEQLKREKDRYVPTALRAHGPSHTSPEGLLPKHAWCW